MARFEQHSSFAFLVYYLIYILWKGTFILPVSLTLLIVIFGSLPDFDAIYLLFKKKEDRKIGMKFQHHYYFWTHWPLSYSPLIIIFIISLIFNFYPEYFLAPVIGIYVGHFLLDSISCGDGIMWGKIPWKKNQYARFFNFWPGNCGGYHGVFWKARYRKTLMNRMCNIAVIISTIIISTFYIISVIEYFQGKNPPGMNFYYVAPVIAFILSYFIWNKFNSLDYLKEPPEGRYADYRVNTDYISRLSEKSRRRHLEKYSEILKKKNIIIKVN